MRGGANRRVLDAIVKDGRIFDAWDDEKWVVKGVAVRVSLICFSAYTEERQPQLDGKPVERIGADLTASKSDLTTARRLRALPSWATPRVVPSMSLGSWPADGCYCH
jgi:hypothetical protein